MMQQSANMSGGVQVIVLAQPALVDSQQRYRNMTVELTQKYNMLGQAHIALGILCCLFQIVSLTCSPYSSSGAGIWTGTMFIVTGVFGYFAGKNGGKCQVITFQVLSIISAGFAFILFCEATTFAVFAWSAASVAMESLMALASLGEGIVAICSSITGCNIGVCCCNCGNSCPCCCPTEPEYHQFDNPLQADIAQQQFITGNQQQSMLNSNQQLPPYSLNQQLPPFSPNQQQPMINSNEQLAASIRNQQPLVFNPNQPGFYPNQQQQISNPNQQQPVFIPNQQQLMLNQKQQQQAFNLNQQPQFLVFNPNQSQQMFLQNQQMIGCYPQQYAVLNLAPQSNVSPNPPQPTSSASSTEISGQGANTVDCTGLTTTSQPSDLNAQPNVEGPDESLIRFSGSEEAVGLPNEAPPPYENNSGWNYSQGV